MTDIAPQELIDMYQDGFVDENSEHFEDNEDDDNETVNTIGGSEHVSSDRTHEIVHMQQERQAMQAAANELSRTLGASRTHVQRTIGASSEIAMRTVAVRGGYPTKLCEINQLRTSVKLWIPPYGNIWSVAIATDSVAPFAPAVGMFPPNAVILSSMSEALLRIGMTVLELRTVRDLWAMSDPAMPATEYVNVCVLEEFVA